MPIQIYRKGATIAISEHFKSYEFNCKCSNPDCYFTYIDDSLISFLEVMRGTINRPITITSGYRCQKHQDAIKASEIETAKKVSTHVMGGAVDIYTGDLGIELEKKARKAGFKAVGVADTWVHVDVRGDKDRYWKYKTRKKDV